MESARGAREVAGACPTRWSADALLDQHIFSGVGNIIKNEVLHRIRVHPESTVGALPSRKLGEMIKQARDYSFDFLEWKKAYVLRKHWQVASRRRPARATARRCRIASTWAAPAGAHSGARPASGFTGNLATWKP